jgi:hypothetical protein
MVAVRGTELEAETDGIANVLCEYCHEKLGRVQTEPPPGADPLVWQEEVRGELEVLAREHETLCARR